MQYRTVGNSGLKVNETETVEDAMVAAGFPQKNLKSDDEVAALLQAQAEEAQKDEQLEDAERLSKIAAEQSKEIQPGSGLEMVLEGMR